MGKIERRAMVRRVVQDILKHEEKNERYVDLFERLKDKGYSYEEAIDDVGRHFLTEFFYLAKEEEEPQEEPPEDIDRKFWSEFREKYFSEDLGEKFPGMPEEMK